MRKRNRSGAEKKRARKRRLAQEREAEEWWLGHFGPERPGRDVTWSSISPTPYKR